MAIVSGKVGPWQITWLKVPTSSEGIAELEILKVGQPQNAAKRMEVRWRQDEDGIWVELPDMVCGFDVDAENASEGEGDGDGERTYWLMKRGSDQEWAHLSFRRLGEELTAGAAAQKKKGIRVKAQMPGKILRVIVKEDQVIEKDQPLAVMEAMKMENEIRAAQAGRVTKVSVTEGQAVETGAELFVIDTRLDATAENKT